MWRRARFGVLGAALLVLCIPPAFPTQNAEAMQAYDSGDFALAAQIFRREIAQGNAPALSYLYLGISMIRVGRGPDAVEPLAEYVRQDPTDSRGWTGLGTAHFARGEFQAAIEAFQRSLEIVPSQPFVAKLLGRTYVVTGQNAEAERALTQAAALNETDAEALYLLGRLYQSTGRLQDSAARFERTLELQPDHIKAKGFLGTVYYGLGRQDDARRLFEDAVRENRASRQPDYAPHLEYGIFLQRIGDLDHSIQELRRAIELNPTDVDCHFEAGRSYYRKGELAEAKKALAYAMSINPDDSRPYHLMGRICYEQGDEKCGRANSLRAEELRRKVPGGSIPD